MSAQATISASRLAMSAIEASPNGVMLLDAGDRIEWCNSTAADHLGVDPARDIGQPLTNLVRAPSFVAHLQARKADEPLTFTIPARRGALAVWVRPYGDGQVLLITQDVTERLRTDEMRRDFVANASHEIRTPLTVLAGFVDTMAQIDLTPPERRRVLSLMKEQTDRMRATFSISNSSPILMSAETWSAFSSDRCIVLCAMAERSARCLRATTGECPAMALRRLFGRAIDALTRSAHKKWRDAGAELAVALDLDDAAAALRAARNALFTKEGAPRKLAEAPAVTAALDAVLELERQVAQQDAHDDHRRMVRLSRALIGCWHDSSLRLERRSACARERRRHAARDRKLRQRAGGRARAARAPCRACDAARGAALWTRARHAPQKRFSSAV